MLRIPAGSFMMGSPDTERGRRAGEGPQHPVTLTQGFYLGEDEVTRRQWRAVMGANPSSLAACGDDCPVETVSWNDIAGAGGFLEKLNQHLASTGQPGAGKLRLPTEAEWEYGARAGAVTRFTFGDNLSCDDSCGACQLADEYMWWCGNADRDPHPAGGRKPNAFGLHDMNGNVWELVQDWFGLYPSSPQTDPSGPAAGSFRTIRGGGFASDAFYCRSAYRDGWPADAVSSSIGFRLARSQ
jgi:formylglycine-generating enzyme required for sulfatase activity